MHNTVMAVVRSDDSPKGKTNNTNSNTKKAIQGTSRPKLQTDAPRLLLHCLA